MKIAILHEAGYEQAAVGFSLSYNSTPERAKQIFPKFALKGGGESKFLESIILWMDVTAPRYWWAQADTYRMSTKQSESTMHTLGKRPLTQSDFEEGLPTSVLDILNHVIEKGHKNLAKRWLPESFLQRRIWCLSYRTAQNIYRQRKEHKLPEWQAFCTALEKQLQHPELL